MKPKWDCPALDVEEDKFGTIWISTFGGLNKFDRQSGTFSHYRHDPKNPHSLENNRLTSIYENEQTGDLWIGSFVGLVHFNRDTEKFTTYKNDQTDPYSLGSNFVWTIYGDRTGTLWMTHFGDGVSKLDLGKSQFEHILAEYSISSLLENQPGMLWASSFEQGLVRLNRTTGQVTEFRSDPNNPNSLRGHVLNCLSQDDSGNIWVGTMKWIEPPWSKYPSIYSLFSQP